MSTSFAARVCSIAALVVVSIAVPSRVAGAMSAPAVEPSTPWSWGRNLHGQLGTGDRAASSTPLQLGGSPAATALAAGQEHSLVLDGNGTVWAWGANGFGQLGIGV